ncbi:MAG: hypothetical protein KIT08_11005 [Anaerolineales bacterium]|nr:MAG: hypothetical protein KIT08_11005 [Anaerolineales bacterium]
MSAVSDLLQAIFGNKQPNFYAEFEGWLRSSRRFRDFAHAYRNKIRAKLNNAKHPGSQEDLYAELQAAATFLRPPHFALEYDHYAAAKQRGPDFTVTFRSRTLFNVEVRRVAVGPQKLAAIVCEKVGQLPPSSINLVWLAAADALGEAELAATHVQLRQAAESKEDGYFQNRGFASAAEFVKRYPRLSGIVLYQSGVQALWLNPIARHAVPRDLQSALRQLQSGD